MDAGTVHPDRCMGEITGGVGILSQGASRSLAQARTSSRAGGGDFTREIWFARIASGSTRKTARVKSVILPATRLRGSLKGAIMSKPKDRRISWAQFKKVTRCGAASCSQYYECAYKRDFYAPRTSRNCGAWRELPTVKE